MTEPPVMTAHVQHDDYLGTAAADAGDLDDLAQLLNLPENQHLLGVSVSAQHPLLDGTSDNPGATSSYTHLELWTVDHDAWTAMPGGLPEWLTSPRPLTISSYSAPVTNAEYPQPQNDAIGILLRASKRLHIVLWVEEVTKAGLTPDDFDIAHAFSRESADHPWQEIDTND